MSLQTTDFAKDYKILLTRLDLDPDSVQHEDGSLSLRWAHADDPWLSYTAEGTRAPSDVEDVGWQRDRPFWAIIDQASFLTDEQLVQAWEDACFAHTIVKDNWRLERMGLTADDATSAEEYRPEWDALRQRLPQYKKLNPAHEDFQDARSTLTEHMGFEPSVAAVLDLSTTAPYEWSQGEEWGFSDTLAREEFCSAFAKMLIGRKLPTSGEAKAESIDMNAFFKEVRRAHDAKYGQALD